MVHSTELGSRTWTVRTCRLPATASVLRRVRRCADDAAAEFGFSHSERYEFVFAINEAVTNAIRHGRPDPDGMIGLRIDADGDMLICSVSDSGCFRLGLAGDDPLAETGRGFTLMAELTDQVELSSTPAGTTVRLHKRRPPTSEV
jgi:anti-sigma regulatory factor (Ser/Thr protein kinase)